MKVKSLILVLFISLVSCSKTIEEDPMDTSEEPIVDVELTNEVLVYDAGKISDDLVLVNDIDTDEVYLLKKDGTKFYEWTLTNEVGNDVVLEEDGKLLALLHSDNDIITIAGHGGQIQVINSDNSIEWQFVYSSEDYNLHHDIERLPNGNIIALLWERKTVEESKEKGFIGDYDIFIESVIEINPITNEIVWKWSSWDHLVQDNDSTKFNYASIAGNPQLININYNDIINGDIMHANAIEYNSTDDLIYVSVNFYSEVWIIDHNTTTSEAASNSGGNYGKGGDLVYRFGNPSAYNSMEERLFYNNHNCNIIKEGLPGAGNLLVFMNGDESLQSKVYELELPSDLDINKQPNVKWFFDDVELYSSRVSGAFRVANGNTLITEGDFGYWEVTEDKEVVWQYSKPGFFWRGYPYPLDSNAINNLQ